MIIGCKGVRKSGKKENCSFTHNGNWGDEELIKHQLFHEFSSAPNVFWLGFETHLPIGQFSGRDGKES